MFKIMIGVVIAAAVIIIGFMVIDPKVNMNGSNITDVSSVNANSYTIEGEVVKPGTYKMDNEVTMADLIEAAGGLTNNSDELAFFYDITLTAGSSYYIASKYDANDVCNNSAIEKVNINKDNAETLTKINGITSSIANSIVSYRMENTSFTTLEQLMDVYGIGNATYRKIRNYITLHE